MLSPVPITALVISLLLVLVCFALAVVIAARG